ncbi:MAG: chromosomal replication initiator protein DnaA [Planctomycetes bacterium]|nr:chromosomal replication initiator protein DnaA [Planctomycetota bacterium]
MPALDPRLTEQIRAHLARTIEPHLYRQWLEHAPFEGGLDGGIDVGVPNQFASDYFEKSLRGPIETAVNVSLGMTRSVRFVVRPDATLPVRPEVAPAVPPAAAPAASVLVQVASPPRDLRLNPDYSFDQFVVGPSNRLAHAAALAVSEAPGKAYNPLFIHGAVGLGKTHLLQALCHSVRARLPNAVIDYLPCEEFVNAYIASLKEQKVEQFRARYRGADVLLVDDVHFLANKTGSQEEFFHMFNALRNASRQLVFSSDAPPKDIPTLEERLASRFNWGIVARLDPPLFETRAAILRQKAQQRGAVFPDDVVDFVAVHIETNIRDLESAALKLIATALVERRAIDIELARRILQEHTAVPSTRLTVADIQNAVSRHFHVRISDMQSRKRNRSISVPRQITGYLIRTLLDIPLQDIGGYLGGKDHTTIMYGIGRVKAKMESDFQFRATIEHLAAELRRLQST